MKQAVHTKDTHEQRPTLVYITAYRERGSYKLISCEYIIFIYSERWYQINDTNLCDFHLAHGVILT